MSTRTISHYQLAEKIGAGGNGAVWKAYDTLLERWVALKFLHDKSASDPSNRERFFREARAVSALNHPNIITIHEINTDGAEPFIVMELVSGRPLSQVLKELHHLPASLTADYAGQLCNGLGAAHRTDIVHRDIKPSNIMVTQDGIIKILDFGLAKSSAQNSSAEPLTKMGTVVGTVPYMSPEQAAGDLVGPRSDVFSVGIVLYELLTGRRPFQGCSNTAIIHALLATDPEPLSALVPDVPEALAKIVHKCLRKRPEERYRDACEVCTHLKALDRSAWPVAKYDLATATMGAVARPLSQIRQRPKHFAAIGILLLALTSLSAYRYWPAAKHDKPSQSAATSLAQTEVLKRAQAYLQRYDRKDNVSSAVALLESAMQQGGASAAVYATLAEAYVRKYSEFGEKRWLTKALDAGRQAVRLNYDLEAGHCSLGMALRVSGEKAAAIEEFEHAIAMNPLSAPAHFGLAWLKSGEQAEQLYQKAVALSPNTWIPHHELAYFYYREARIDESIAAWKKALSLAEDNATLMVNLGAALHKAGRYAEASESFQHALQLDDSKALTWANLGTIRYFQGRFLDAARATEKAVERAPSRYKYQGNLGDNYRWAEGKKHLAGGAYRKAIELLRSDLKLNPSDTALQTTLAAYLAKSGDTSEALFELSKLGELKGSEPLFKASLVYEISGDRSKALATLESAIRAGFSMHEIVNEPELSLLRSDPRYARIAGLSTQRKKE